MASFSKSDIDDIDLEVLMNDRKAFNDLVYTPLAEAVEELGKRKVRDDIPETVSVPEILLGKPKAIIFRQLVTANYEIRRFVSLLESTMLEPVFWEYYRDKFTSNNEWKHSLGKLSFYQGTGKKGGAKIESFPIIDFNSYNGKPIADVQTLWGESLVQFHHQFFKDRFGKKIGSFFDASDWFASQGGSAKDYYTSFLKIFVKNAILFENFMLDEKEYTFTRDIFLPSFLSVWKETGCKPLIVSLEPTDIEGDKFWICHPFVDKKYVQKRLEKRSLGAIITALLFR